MIHSTLFRASTCLVFLALFFASAYSTPDPEELRLLVSEPTTTLQLSRGLPVKNSSGSSPGTVMVCERVYIQGLRRFQNLKKVAHTVTVKVLMRNSSSRIPNFEVCFHRNMSLGIGMCSQSQWEKVFKGSWAQFMSPFDHKILDIRSSGVSLESFEVSIEEEYFLYRIIFLTMGVVLMSSASILSKSLVFYLGSGTLIRFLLLLLMILFQGMKLLLSGRNNSLGIFLYAYVAGLGSFFLRYVLGLLDQILLEMRITISKDMFDPVALVIFLLASVCLNGTWLGIWVDHKFIHYEDGIVDKSISFFITWSIRILATFLVLHSSLDPLLATGVLICGIMASSMLRKILKFMSNLFKSSKEMFKTNMPRLNAYEDPGFNRSESRNFLVQSCSSFIPGDVYPSTFHSIPEQRKFSKDEWKKFTKDSTKKALEGLGSSPDFSRWLVDNADRINITPRARV